MAFIDTNFQPIESEIAFKLQSFGNYMELIHMMANGDPSKYNVVIEDNASSFFFNASFALLHKKHEQEYNNRSALKK